MIDARVLDLAGNTRGATAAGGLVWRAVDDGVGGHDATDGATRVELDLASITGIGGCDELLVAQVASGDLVGLDPESGEQLFTGWAEPGAWLVGATAVVWVCETDAGRARRYTRHGTVAGPLEIGRASRLAVAADDELWWCTDEGVLGTSAGRTHEVVVPAGGSGATACASSLWMGGRGELARVSLWSGEQGPSIPTPVGAVEVLACCGGRVVGADDESAFVLDPAADAGPTRVDPSLGAPPVAAVGLPDVAWIVTARDALVLRF